MPSVNGKTYDPDCDHFRKIAQDAGFFNDFQAFRAGMEGAGYSKGESYAHARSIFEPRLRAAMGENVGWINLNDADYFVESPQ